MIHSDMKILSDFILSVIWFTIFNPKNKFGPPVFFGTATKQ